MFITNHCTFNWIIPIIERDLYHENIWTLRSFTVMRDLARELTVSTISMWFGRPQYPATNIIPPVQ